MPAQKELASSTAPLAGGFAFIFASFMAVEKNGVAFFAKEGSAESGFAILFFGYFLLFLGDLFLSPPIISRMGTRWSLLTGALTYFLIAVVVPFQSLGLVIPASVLVGLGAALVWNGMSTHVIFQAQREERSIEASMGLVLVAFGLGSGLGLVAFSVLSTVIGMAQAFWVLALLVPVGMIFFRRVGSTTQVEAVRVKDVWRALGNTTLLRLATLSLTTFAVFGVLATQVPLEVSRLMRPEHVGYVTAAAYLGLALCLAVPTLRRLGVHVAYGLAALGLATLIAAAKLDNVGLLITGALLLCFSTGPLFVTMLTMSSLAPNPTKVLIAQAIFTSVDDLTIALVALLSFGLTKWGVSFDTLYYVALAATVGSYLLLRPLLQHGTLEGARGRLAAWK